MSQPITSVEGVGIVVRGDNIDTDRIIPARYLKQLTFDALGEGAFVDDRAQMKSKGALHPFDDPKFSGGNILVVNTNFGCGSSREAAPQALYRYGIRAVIGVTFGEIFFSSATAIGMPCIKVSEADALSIQALTAQGQVPVSINVEKEFVLVNSSNGFQGAINEGVKTQLLSGTWDALADLLRYGEQIQAVYKRLPYTAWQVNKDTLDAV